MAVLRNKRWWWIATVPAVAVMLAASSSMYVHAYLPSTHHKGETADFDEPVSFDFDQRVDDFEFTNAATVRMTRFEEISQADYATAWEENSFEETWEKQEGLRFYAASIEWEADPMTPLNGCAVMLHYGDGLRGQAWPWVARDDISYEEFLSRTVTSNIGQCEPRGYPGPVDYDVFALENDILPGSQRPEKWVMDYYFVASEEFEPDKVTIDWHKPYQVTLKLPN